MSATAIQTLFAGRPSEALKQLQEHVRRHPADAEQRVFLFQLLSVLGEWDRALTQLKVLEDLSGATAVMAAAYRRTIAGERTRADVFAGRAAPLLFGEPEPWMALLVEAFRTQVAGDGARASALRGEALEAAPATAGSIDGARFEWIADADSRLGPMLEAFMNGQYYWIPFQRLRAIQLAKPADLRDLLWAPAQLVFTNGGGATAMIPARYPGSEAPATDDAIKLGRRTEWVEAAGGVYCGMGQRMLATDVGEHPLLEVRAIVLDETAASSPTVATG